MNSRRADFPRYAVHMLLLVLIISMAGLIAPRRAAAQSMDADLSVYLWLEPEGDRSSNVVEPGEHFYLDMEIENAGQGDARNVTVYVTYNRDQYVLSEDDNIDGINDDEFWLYIDDLLPPGSFRSETVELRTRNDVRPGERIRLEAEYVWNDTRDGRQGTSDDVTLVVGYRDTGDDGDDGATLIVDTEQGEDTTPPVSCMLSILYQNDRTVQIMWGGSDQGSGIDSYDVQIKQMPDGLWRNWIEETEETAAIFGPLEGETFGFRVRARDKAGNVEAWPVNPQLNTSQADLVLSGCPGSDNADAV